MQQAIRQAFMTKIQPKMRLPKGVYLSPMVRGSELAMRELARKHGNASLAYSPMLRDHDVISVHELVFSKDDSDKQQQQRFQSFKELKIDKAGRTNSVEEAAYLLHETSTTDTSNLVVQLCGSSPQTLGRATSAILDIYHNNSATLPFGIDLNLGCPQECAKKEGFGAFLVEKDMDSTISCIGSMRQAIDMYCSRDQNRRITNKPTLSAKIRVLDVGIDDTIVFAKKLKSAGIDFLAVHCRTRQEKHNGKPDWEAGREIVAALPDLPVVLNGGISCHNDVTLVTERTKCHAVMVATGYLSNHQAFNSTIESETGIKPKCVVEIASQYLEMAELYPPPSYLYIQKHLRWIFRSSLQPENDPSFNASNWKDWRVKMWSFLVRPYLRSVEQFRGFLALYVQQSGDQDRVPDSILRLVSDVTFGSVKKAGKRTAREI